MFFKVSEFTKQHGTNQSGGQNMAPFWQVCQHTNNLRYFDMIAKFEYENIVPVFFYDYLSIIFKEVSFST